MPNTHENSIKKQSVTKWSKYDKCGAMGKYVEYLCYQEVEAVEYFELLVMRYCDMNAVNQRV